MSPATQFRNLFSRQRRLAGMAAVAVGTLVTASTAVLPPAHAAIGADFMQCSNDNPPDVLGNCFWINGILQPNNSQYQEGMSVPQRVLLTEIPSTPGDVHTLVFSHDATKGGVHAYDWLTSWDQALASDPDDLLSVLDDCGEMISDTFETICQALTDGVDDFSATADVPDDDFVSATQPDGPLDTTQDLINVYEAAFGNRTIEIFGDAAVGGATLTLVHDPAADGSDDGDSTIVYQLTWTSASTDIMVQLAGHLAVGADGGVGDGWGAALGASSINGGPYHFMLGTLDGASLGSQDNQIMASAVAPRGEPETGRIFVEKQTDPPGATQVFEFTANFDADGFSLTDDGVNNSGALVPGSYSVAESVPAGWTLESVSCVNQDGEVEDPANILLTAGETVTCLFIDVQNPEPGRIIVEKESDEYDTGTEFPFASNFDGNLGDGADFSLEVGESFDSGLLDPGIYAVSELVPAGWDLVSAVCSDGSPVAAIVLGPGETVTCTFTNALEEDDDGYDQYPGDSDFDFDTPFDNAGDPVAPAPTATVGGTNAGDTNVGTQQPQSGDLLAVAGDTQPAPAGDAAPSALGELPRTGAGIRDLTMLAGVMVLIGGLVLLAKPRRRTAHQA